MNDAAVINAGLSGRFTLLGSQALTLGGDSLSLVSLTVSGNVPLTIAPGATLAGTINLNNGSLVIDGEDGNAGRVNNVNVAVGRTVTVNEFGVVTGLLDNRGTATIDGTVAELINRTGGTVTINATGEVTGLLDNSGTATVDGTVADLINQGGGTVTGGMLTINAGGTQDGAVGVGPSGRLVVTGEVIGNILSEGEVEIGGAVTGDVNNQASGELTMTGSISGSLTNAGEAGIAGSLGSLLNTGEVSFDGATTIDGLTENEGVMEIAAGVTLTATGGLQNRNGGAVEVLGGGSIAGAISNGAGSVITLRNGSTTTGGMTNAGTLEIDGAVSVEILAQFGDIPVIFITAFPERLLTGERPEPAFLINKPYTEEQVRSAVSQAMFFASTETLHA